MVNSSLELLKKLRNETKASVSDCRSALDQSGGNYQKAIEWIRKRGLEKADKKLDRQTSQGLIESYIHQNGRVGAMVLLLCETDFVARTSEFKHLAHEIAMQVAAMKPKTIEELLKQDYIRDSSKTMHELIKEEVGKLGENIVVNKISRLEIGV